MKNIIKDIERYNEDYIPKKVKKKIKKMRE